MEGVNILSCINLVWLHVDSNFMFVDDYELTKGEKAELQDLHVQKIKIVEERDQLVKQVEEERLRWVFNKVRRVTNKIVMLRREILYYNWLNNFWYP